MFLNLAKKKKKVKKGDAQKKTNNVGQNQQEGNLGSGFRLQEMILRSKSIKLSQKAQIKFEVKIKSIVLLKLNKGFYCD